LSKTYRPCGFEVERFVTLAFVSSILKAGLLVE